MPEKPKLSIVIPSYNRNRTVLHNLPVLLAQLRPDIELSILDNCSREPLLETLTPLLARNSSLDVKIIRHETNVGAAANILRSFEVARAPWLWILGDDDIVTPDAVEVILRAIEDSPEAAFLNFRTATMKVNGLRPHTFKTKGQDEFARDHDFPGNVNFMSVGVWRVQLMLPVVHLAYHYAYSMSPTFVLLLAALGKQHVCHFSHEVLVDTVTTAEVSTKWHFGDFILGWNTILELPMPEETRLALAAKMYSWHAPENVCVFLLAEALHKPNGAHRYSLAVHRLSPYIGTFAWIRYQLYKPLFWSPRLSWRLVESIVRVAVRLKLKGIDLSDIMERAGH